MTLVAHIDLAAIRHNHQLARRCAPGRSLFAVVKANAYGHGVRELVSALHDEVDGFAVATLSEAAEVRALHGQARILLLNGCDEPALLPMVAQLGLDLGVHSEAQLEAVLASTLPQPLNVWLRLDSGMHQLGFAPERIRQLQAQLQGLPQLAELNLFSQLACAGQRGHALNALQMDCFAELLDLPFQQRSLADSAALLTLPGSHLDWPRIGRLLYGISPCADWSAAELGLRPAMQLRARLAAVHVLEDDDQALPGVRRVGVVNCGYADGYPAQAADGTPVWLRGQLLPLLGPVAMDNLRIDLSDCPQAEPGDEVELWGAQLPIEQLAARVGVDAAALLCAIGPRVLRQYAT